MEVQPPVYPNLIYQYQVSVNPGVTGIPIAFYVQPFPITDTSTCSMSSAIVSSSKESHLSVNLSMARDTAQLSQEFYRSVDPTALPFYPQHFNQQSNQYQYMLPINSTTTLGSSVLSEKSVHAPEFYPKDYRTIEIQKDVRASATIVVDKQNSRKENSSNRSADYEMVRNLDKVDNSQLTSSTETTISAAFETFSLNQDHKAANDSTDSEIESLSTDSTCTESISNDSGCVSDEAGSEMDEKFATELEFKLKEKVKIKSRRTDEADKDATRAEENTASPISNYDSDLQQKGESYISGDENIADTDNQSINTYLSSISTSKDNVPEDNLEIYTTEDENIENIHTISHNNQSNIRNLTSILPSSNHAPIANLEIGCQSKHYDQSNIMKSKQSPEPIVRVRKSSRPPMRPIPERFRFLLEEAAKRAAELRLRLEGIPLFLPLQPADDSTKPDYQYQCSGPYSESNGSNNWTEVENTQSNIYTEYSCDTPVDAFNFYCALDCHNYSAFDNSRTYYHGVECDGTSMLDNGANYKPVSPTFYSCDTECCTKLSQYECSAQTTAPCGSQETQQLFDLNNNTAGNDMISSNHDQINIPTYVLYVDDLSQNLVAFNSFCLDAAIQ